MFLVHIVDEKYSHIRVTNSTLVLHLPIHFKQLVKFEDILHCIWYMVLSHNKWAKRMFNRLEWKIPLCIICKCRQRSLLSLISHYHIVYSTQSLLKSDWRSNIETIKKYTMIHNRFAFFYQNFWYIIWCSDTLITWSDRYLIYIYPIMHNNQNQTE